MDVSIALSDCFNKILRLVAECPPIDHKAEVASLTSEIDDLRQQYRSGEISEKELSDSRYIIEKVLRIHKHQVWLRKYLTQKKLSREVERT